MGSSLLWIEARNGFETKMRQNCKDAASREALDEFLAQNDNPNATSLSAKKIAEDASKKWDDGKIPKKWVNKIMSNIDQFTKATSSVVDFAPESVKLAWFGINLTLSAIKSNYDLYGLFGAGLTDITDVLILSVHHDRLYDKRTKTRDGFQSSDLLDKLFQDIKNAYALVLEFAFSVKRHLNPNLGKRLLHTFKHIMGLFKDQFQGILNSIGSAKEAILEGSQAVFQDRALAGLSSIENILSDFEGATKGITDFQDDLQEMKKNQFESFDLILAKLEVISSSTKPKTPWEMSLQEFEGNMASLGAQYDTTLNLEQAMSRRFPNTCQWIFEDQDYLNWIQPSKSGILWLTGSEGSGKSVILGTVVGHLSVQSTIESNGAETMIIYSSCKTPTQVAGTDSPSADKVCHGLLYQLCCLVRALSAESTDVGLIEGCNEVFRLSTTKNSINMSFMPAVNNKKTPDFVQAFTSIAGKLKMNVVVALDEVDSLNPAEQRELASRLQCIAGSANKANSSQAWLKFLVAWHQVQDYSDQVPGSICIDIESRSKGDRDTVISAELEKIPGLTSDERKQAKEEILKKAGSWFTYVNEIGIPFMREPFQRPLSNHLKFLPEGMNTIYMEALNRMSANYVELLQEALRWCLLSEVPVPAVVVMDAYHRRYSKDSSEPHAPEMSEDGGKFPGISSLEVKQLRDAGGPFLQLDGDGLIRPRNARQVREFCLDLDEATTGHQDTRDATCTQCKASLAKSNSITISSKKDHLKIALTCLRHMNNPSFQKRSMAQAQGVLRYEAAFWTQHLRIAEGLWTPNKRKESEEWSMILKELSYLFHRNGPAEVEFLTWWQVNTTDTKSLLLPLHIAAGFGLCFWAEHLLDDLKEDPNSFVEMPERDTGKVARLYPLHSAATKASPHMHELLLQHGADTNADVGFGMPIFLYWLMQDSSFDTVKLMLNYGADHTVQSYDHCNALHLLAMKGDQADTLKLLLSSSFKDRQLDINYTSNQMMASPLHCLLNAPRIPTNLLRAFLEHGADVNAEMYDSKRPLQQVSARGNIEALKVLCDNQVISDIDDPDSVGGTALSAAAEGNHTDCMEVLLQLKADVNKSNSLGQTPLHVAALRGNVEAVKVLLDHDADVGCLDNVNATALLIACNGNPRAAETASLIFDRMVEQNFSLSQINGKPEGNWTLLSRACRFGLESVVQRLLRLAQDRNDKESLAIDSQEGAVNTTALHSASLCGSQYCARLLLEAGASIKVVDNFNRTALVAAYQAWTLLNHLNSFQEIIKMMIEKDPTAAINDAELVATCALNGNVHLLELLYQHNADFCRQDRFGWTPLQLAKDSHHTDAIRFLERQDVWGNRLPSYWPPFPQNSTTTVSDGGLSVCHSKPAMLPVFADKPVPSGLRIFYFELTLEELPGQDPIPPGQVSVANNPGVGIGFCTINNGNIVQYPGLPPTMTGPLFRSWGYSGHNGGFFEGKLGPPQIHGTPYTSGMTVGCGVDMTTHHIWFTCDGRKLDGQLENVHGRLYPMIGLQLPIKVKANFKGPFMWQEGADSDRTPSS